MSQVVSLAGSDPLSGVAATYYTIDGGTRQTYTSPVHRVGAGLAHRHLLVGRRRRQHRGDQHRLREHRHRRRRRSPTTADGAWHNTAVTVHLTARRHRRQRPRRHAVPAAGRLARGRTATGNAFTVPAPADGSGDGVHVYQYQRSRQRRQLERDRQLHRVDRRDAADHDGRSASPPTSFRAGAPPARR